MEVCKHVQHVGIRLRHVLEAPIYATDQTVTLGCLKEEPLISPRDGLPDARRRLFPVVFSDALQQRSTDPGRLPHHEHRGVMAPRLHRSEQMKA